MAKKSATATATKTGGKGKKECPSCGKFTGARAAECPCGFKFQPKGPRAGKKSAGMDIAALIALASEAEQHGGLAKIAAVLEKYDSVISRAGGLAELRDSIAAIDQIKALK